MTPNRTMLELKHLSLSGRGAAQRSPNRTMLELKPQRLFCRALAHTDSQSHHAGIETQSQTGAQFPVRLLPIAPCWNWNTGTPHKQEILYSSQSHHAGIETLEPYEVFAIQQSLPIAPCWNWNEIWTGELITRFRLPIAPCWNWNSILMRFSKMKVKLPIAPCWNWNNFIILSIYQFRHTPNRTMLELKLESISN